MLPLPSPLLLFRQVCLLAAVAGILALREPAQGALFALLLLLLDWSRSGKAGAVLLLVLSFACGLLYAEFRETPVPAMPPWLRASTDLIHDPERGDMRPPAARIRATVKEVTPQDGNRLRIILTDIQPVFEKNGTLAATLEQEKGKPSAGYLNETYAGNIAWTWKDPLFTPLPGTALEATLRLSPVRDMKNPGTWSTEEYWRDRAVFLRAWSQGEQPSATPLPGPEAPCHVRLRSELHHRFLQALFVAGTEPSAPPLAEHGPPGNSTPSRLGGQISQGAAMLPALIFGDRSLLSEESTDRFARATLTHSLSLSGLHLGYAAAAGFALAWLLGRIFPPLLLRVPRPKLALLLALPLAGGYLWLGQAPISLARSALMFVFWVLLLFLHRPKVILDGLLAALGVLLLLDPFSFFDLSLQLSVLSVAVIALSLPLIQSGLRARIPGRGRAANAARAGLTILCMSFCIQVALSPLLIRTFGTAGLWFPLNVLWLPVMGAWTMPFAFAGLFLSAFGLQGPAAMTLYLASLPGDALFALLEVLDKGGLLIAPVVLRPHWLSMAGFWLLCLLLPGLWWGRVAAKSTSGAGSRIGPAAFSWQRIVSRQAAIAGLGVALLCLPLVWSWQEGHRPGVRLRLLDVGQGQAVLIEWGGLHGPHDGAGSSGRALVDGGGFSSASFDVGEAIVSPALTDNRPPELDIVINSHPDTDHLSGLLYIVRNFQVGLFLENGDTPPPSLDEPLRAALGESGTPQRVAAAGDRIALAPGLALEVLWPPASSDQVKEPGESGNADSLILRLVWQGAPLALICGDAEPKALRELLRQNADLAACVLVLPHHGSGKSAVRKLYEAVAPRLALASCGYGNQWGFPSPKVRGMLNDLAVPLHTTAESGQIRLEWRAPRNIPSLETARPPAGDTAFR